MIIVQVVLGGITRLTGSGLSITEWKPLVGVVPPLNELEWRQAFDKYQQIAQFKQLNAHFSVGDFKFIFFWEWFHRLWGRLLGLVFLVPFFNIPCQGNAYKDHDSAHAGFVYSWSLAGIYWLDNGTKWFER